MTVLTVLLVVFLSREFVSVLAKSAEGKYPADLVLNLVLLNMPLLISMVLPLSLFLGILMAYGRMYAESEMVVLNATGVSEWYVARVTMILALLSTLLGAWISLHLVPWSKEREAQIIEDMKASAGIKLLVEGQFKTASNDETVLFVEEISKDGTILERVFVAQVPRADQRREQPFSLVQSRVGKVVEKPDGSAYMVLAEGSRWQGYPGQMDYNIIDFDSYTMLLKELDVEKERRKLDMLPLGTLVGSDDLTHQVELQWRLAVPLAIPILALIAVPLSSVNPRQGKFAKLFPAILLYLGYFMLLMAGRRALDDEKVPIELGLWWVHALALLLGAGLIVSGRETGARVRAALRRDPE
jgi:lipopolysaccharide export system permease protein